MLFSIINIFILWFVAWPLASFCSMIYIFVAPFGACIPGKRSRSYEAELNIFDKHAISSMTCFKKALSGRESWVLQSKMATRNLAARFKKRKKLNFIVQLLVVYSLL